MSSLLLLQITDTHLFADASVVKNGIYPTSSLKSVLDIALNGRTPGSCPRYRRPGSGTDSEDVLAIC